MIERLNGTRLACLIVAANLLAVIIWVMPVIIGRSTISPWLAIGLAAILVVGGWAAWADRFFDIPEKEPATEIITTPLVVLWPDLPIAHLSEPSATRQMLTMQEPITIKQVPVNLADEVSFRGVNFLTVGVGVGMASMVILGVGFTQMAPAMDAAAPMLGAILPAITGPIQAAPEVASGAPNGRVSATTADVQMAAAQADRSVAFTPAPTSRAALAPVQQQQPDLPPAAQQATQDTNPPAATPRLPKHHKRPHGEGSPPPAPDAGPPPVQVPPGPAVPPLPVGAPPPPVVTNG